ncbi:MAG: 30S ribosomal protein S17 [Anaerolineales bacterium]|nr:30S ribosomal protein S17 [Anaerolineales bacterium]
MKNTRRRMTGVVTRTNSAKTVTVQVDRTSRHRLYGKVLRASKNYLVHDEIGCRLGDEVLMVESRPISKRKRWAVEEILRRKTEAEVTAETVETQDVTDVEAQA